MGECRYCYILQTYYVKHPDLIKILDFDNPKKHDVRTHLCLNIKYNNNNILIPLRKKLGDPIRLYGKIGFSVPTETKPLAGLDYRYVMIINDCSYLKFDVPRIPNSQIKKILDNYNDIESDIIEYIESYIRVAKKNRVQRTARFRESSLINFHNELKI